MRRYLYLAAVVGSTLCATLVASTAAYADTGAVLTVGTAGGQNAAVGDTVAATLARGKSATFYSTTTGTTGVKCSASSPSSIDGRHADRCYPYQMTSYINQKQAL